jgi:hypothetical protein
LRISGFAHFRRAPALSLPDWSPLIPTHHQKSYCGPACAPLAPTGLEHRAEALCGGLSPVAIATIRTILREIAASGTAILLVEQNVQLAVALTDGSHVLNRGAVEAAGATADLAQNPALADTCPGGRAAG